MEHFSGSYISLDLIWRPTISETSVIVVNVLPSTLPMIRSFICRFKWNLLSIIAHISASFVHFDIDYQGHDNDRRQRDDPDDGTGHDATSSDHRIGIVAYTDRAVNICPGA